MDMMLRFPDEQTAQSELYTDDGFTRYNQIIDTIGVIYNAEQPLPGWHVNTRGDEPDELEPYRVNPAVPYRVWF